MNSLISKFIKILYVLAFILVAFVVPTANAQENTSDEASPNAHYDITKNGGHMGWCELYSRRNNY